VQAPSNDFASWLNGRVLFYGTNVQEQFDGELTGVDAGLSGRVTYDWSLVASTTVTLPRPTKGRFSQCVTIVNDADFNQLRVQKTTQILEILAPVPGINCIATVASVEPQTLPQRLLALGQRLLAPAPLQATSLLRTGSPTGGAGSFSPFQIGNPLGVDVTFLNQPKDAKVNQPIVAISGGNLKVFVDGDAGTPWEDVLIQLEAFNNNGTTVQTLNSTAATNAQGIAEFAGFSITKTGSYKLRAVTLPPSDPDVQGFVPASDLSNKFNVRP
jgi:hypothetical protein